MSGPKPGTPEHRRLVTASKVSAILGVSPWQSPYSLWMEMKGLVEPEPTNTVQSRGNYLEPAILAWWRDQHTIDAAWPDYAEQVWRPFEDWAGATVDAEIVLDGVLEIVEVKSAVSLEDWGTPGTDEIPSYYLAQVLMQLACSNAARCHVAVFGGRLEFREYVVEADPDEQARVIAACRRFYESLADDVPPPLDAHRATYDTVRKLHPEIDDAVAQIDGDLAAEYVTASVEAKSLAEVEQLAKTRLLDAMGRAKRAEYAGQLVAVRQPNRYGVSLIRKASHIEPTKESA